jgi:hypothetical protein
MPVNPAPASDAVKGHKPRWQQWGFFCACGKALSMPANAQHSLINPLDPEKRLPRATPLQNLCAGGGKGQAPSPAKPSNAAFAKSSRLARQQAPSHQLQVDRAGALPAFKSYTRSNRIET